MSKSLAYGIGEMRAISYMIMTKRGDHKLHNMMVVSVRQLYKNKNNIIWDNYDKCISGCVDKLVTEYGYMEEMANIKAKELIDELKTFQI